MIKVQVEKLPSSGDFLTSSINEMYNDMATGFAEDIEATSTRKKCKSHPDQDSVLRIIVKKDGNLAFDKTGFCCSDFADSVDYQIIH